MTLYPLILTGLVVIAVVLAAIIVARIEREEVAKDGGESLLERSLEWFAPDDWNRGKAA